MKTTTGTRSLFLPLLFVFLCTAARAQTETKQAEGTKPFYIQLSAGYGMGVDRRNLMETEIARVAPQQGSDFTSSYDKGFSLGNGVRAEATLGWKFSKNVGAELSGSFLSANTVIRTLTSSSYVYEFTSAVKMNSTLFSFSPSLIFSNELGPLHPYARIGFIAGFTSIKLENDTKASYEYTSSITSSNAKLSGNMAMGMRLGLGNTISLCDKLDFVQELGYTSLSYSPDKATITAYSENGKDALAGLSTSQKQFVFRDESSKWTYKTDQPAILPRTHIPYSSISIMLGLRFHL